VGKELKERAREEVARGNGKLYTERPRFMFNIADGGFTGTEGWSIALLTLSKPSSANTHYTLSSGDRTTPLGVGKHIVGDPKNE
jgi:hypothetical protein